MASSAMAGSPACSGPKVTPASPERRARRRRLSAVGRVLRRDEAWDDGALLGRLRMGRLELWIVQQRQRFADELGVGDDADGEVLAVQLHLLGQQASDELGVLSIGGAWAATQAVGHVHRPAGVAREDVEI